MGSLFTERAQPAGTFSHDDAKIGYPGRTPDLYYGYAWDDSPNAYGAAGRVFGPGSIATHGSLSPFDLTSVLIISGPDIRTGAVSPAPSGVVDIAPTVAWMSGLTPKGMDGHRHVRNEGQVVRARTGEGPETFASAFQAPGESAAIPRGVPFQLAKLANQVFVDDPGKNAPRSCVQIDVVLIIEKATTNVLPVRFV